LKQTITAPYSATQTFTYDKVNRLKSASGLGWSRTLGYDQFGNMAVTAANPAVDPAHTPTVFANFTNNQWRPSGSVYDGAGNLQTVAGDQFTFDAENRMVAANIMNTGTVQYFYDGKGRRVQKMVGPVTTTYVYDAFDQLVAEYGGAVQTQTPLYLHGDPLGSTRILTDATGAAVRGYDYYPFGEEVPATVGTRPSYYKSGGYPGQPDLASVKFTGKERDAETGLDDFGARYLSGAQGRFTTSDEITSGAGGAYEVGGGRPQEPRPLPYAEINNPQSLNKYSYSLNNPLRYIDPDGHEPSDLIYDGEAHTLTLTSGNGLVVGIWPAANNVAIHAPPAKEMERTQTVPLKMGYTVSLRLISMERRCTWAARKTVLSGRRVSFTFMVLGEQRVRLW